MNPIQQMIPQEKNIAWMKMLKPSTFWWLKNVILHHNLNPMGGIESTQ
jgi:hypothetical protein